MIQNFRFKQAEIGLFKDKSSDLAVSKLDNDCRILGFTNGEFSLIDLIYSVLKKIGRSRVIIATWSAGIKDVHQIKWMYDTDLISDIKLLTDHSYKTRQPRYANSIEDLFGIENIRTSEIHAKFVLIQNYTYKIAIRSSMNLNANRTIELFEIDEGPEIFDFLMNYVCHVFKDMEPGFISDTKKVLKSVNKFFSTPDKNWWEINDKSE